MKTNQFRPVVEYTRNMDDSVSGMSTCNVLFDNICKDMS